ncbi:hypothetical protein FXO38_25540 [Capsicum annuum]|nr:hypothetical protein FXO38_25540 [Capsicum annuum]
MQWDGAINLTSDFVVKSVMGKSFDTFVKILQEQKLDAYSRENYFGKYLDLPKDNNSYFQMKKEYDHLKRKFMYENKDKIDEGRLVVDDGVSGDGAVGGGSGYAIGYNDSSLKVFETTIYYDYDHTGFTDFPTPSECSARKYIDCKLRLDGVINAINALTAFVKELTSKRGVIP